MYSRSYENRLRIVSLTFIILFTLIIIRVIYLQAGPREKLLRLADSQHYVTIELEPRRGSIFDRNMQELAVNLRVDSVYAIARDVQNKRKVAAMLASILNKDEEFLYKRLSRDKLFVWLDRKITEGQAQRIKELKIKGICLIDESKRFYPKARLAAQTIGFAGLDNKGLEGLELKYESYLKGRGGYKAITRDARGREVAAFGSKLVKPIDGYDLVLTIDEVIQHITEKALKKACQKSKARAGVAIVMDPYNGDILALAVEPSFDLNIFSSADKDSKRNRAIADCFEPGSVFKIVTASACLEEGAVKLDDNFYCENGSWYVAGHTLHDFHRYGNLPFKRVIEESSNIGTVKAAMKLGEADLYKHIVGFGFGKVTGIDLNGEIGGIVRPVNKWSSYSITAIPMGQELAVTPIQLAVCVSVIANGGSLVKPRIVQRILDQKGQAVKTMEPVIRRRVISEETARQMRGVMKGVVENGTGKKAKPLNYDAGGKTGTAQKAGPTGGYLFNKFVASFIGFAPADKPSLAICVMIDEPRWPYYGGVVSAPVFKEVAESALRYLQAEDVAEDAENQYAS